MDPLAAFVHWLVFRYTDPSWTHPWNPTGWTWESGDWTTYSIESVVFGWCIVFAIYMAPRLWRESASQSVINEAREGTDAVL